ncbi:hypothetical protein RchiOBHm_Chr1g0350171 [Rosa chinensis]|uniref:Uncharacterized protein n=1 Tax=Rosa chinensis TaxID=74649 RepID=A0A2P6SFZ1_ROSCH|nr:hypothetical protein RchiOBHm_Chr1g0350171 [Rosa chinensis]
MKASESILAGFVETSCLYPRIDALGCFPEVDSLCCSSMHCDALCEMEVSSLAGRRFNWVCFALGRLLGFSVCLFSLGLLLGQFVLYFLPFWVFNEISLCQK